MNLLIKFVISLAMGAVIGIERERRAKGTVFAGFRTFMLICSLGLITAFLHANFSQFFSFLIVLIIGSLCSLNFYRKIAKNKEAGITTEVALLLTFFIGFIFYFEEEPYIFSLGLTFILTWILFLKEKMHEFAHKIKVEEVRDFLIFGLIFFVIYPILPNQPIDPLGTLNLKFVWFGLVLILGLSFFVYIIIKLLKYKGLILDAILGGLINSIYMSNFFSSKLSEGKIAKYAILISTIFQNYCFCP
ncbi:MAG: MgtC/SapB family protein [Candidatus Aenigmatarchaeota archaeon]